MSLLFSCLVRALCPPITARPLQKSLLALAIRVILLYLYYFLVCFFSGLYWFPNTSATMADCSDFTCCPGLACCSGSHHLWDGGCLWM